MRALSILTLACTVALASTTHAQEIEITTVPVAAEAVSVANRWRVHAELSPLLERSDRSFDLTREEFTENASASQERATPRPLGLAPTVGLGLGYGISRDVVFGVALAGGYERITPTSGEPYATTDTSWLVDAAPYWEFLFGRHTWRPFLDVSLHWRYEHIARRYQQSGAASPGSDVFWADHIWWGAGLAGGVRAFVVDGISLDLGVRGRLLLGSAEGFGELSLQLGLSGWL